MRVCACAVRGVRACPWPAECLMERLERGAWCWCCCSSTFMLRSFTPVPLESHCRCRCLALGVGHGRGRLSQREAHSRTRGCCWCCCCCCSNIVDVHVPMSPCPCLHCHLHAPAPSACQPSVSASSARARCQGASTADTPAILTLRQRVNGHAPRTSGFWKSPDEPQSPAQRRTESLALNHQSTTWCPCLPTEHHRGRSGPNRLPRRRTRPSRSPCPRSS